LPKTEVELLGTTWANPRIDVPNSSLLCLNQTQLGKICFDLISLLQILTTCRVLHVSPLYARKRDRVFLIQFFPLTHI